MAKRGMPQIMRQAQRLGQILVQPEGARNHASDLRHFKAVSQANAVMIAIGRDEHLRLACEPAKGNGMDDAIPITLKRSARAPRRCGRAMPRLRKFAAARSGRIGSEGRAGHAMCAIESGAG